MELLENVHKGVVFINGKQILELENPRARHRTYANCDLSAHTSLLRKGRNLLAIQAERKEGVPALDAGLYTLE